MRLQWDNNEDRLIQTGVDHGVLYPVGGKPVSWNGLTEVAVKRADPKLETLYYEGQPFDILSSKMHNSFRISAYTYPDVFDYLTGFDQDLTGVLVDNQQSRYFHVSYRTQVGLDDYQIHLILNQKAIPQEVVYRTIQGSPEPSTFVWETVGVPMRIGEFNTCRLVFDTRVLPEIMIKTLENYLYGTSKTEASVDHVRNYINYLQTKMKTMRITNNNDGTWTADVDDAVARLYGDYFEFANTTARYLDTHTYEMEER